MARLEIDVLANDRTGGALGGIKNVLGNILSTAAGFLSAQVFARIGQEVVDFARDSISAASDLNETLNKTQEIFEGGADAIIKWAENSAQTVGLSQAAALDAASGFAIFGKAAGLAGQDLNDFSTENLTLAADMASFFNTSVEDAALAMQAAFRGETEPIRRYGILLDDASMRAKALELGIISTTKDALTPQQKVLAANALIWEQTADAQGDFARTSQGYANQQRILNAQLENAKAALGQAFLPILTKAMQFINTVGIPALMGLIENIKGLKDINLEGTPFGDFLAFLQLWWQTNGPFIMEQAGRIREALVSAFQQIGEKVGPFINEVLAKFATWLAENGPLIQAFAEKVADTWTNQIAPALVAAWDVIQPILTGIIDLVLGLAKLIMQVATGDWAGAWETIKATATQVWEALKAAFVAFLDLIAKALGSSLDEIKTMWTNNWNQFVEIVGKVKGILLGKVREFVDVGKALVNFIKQGIANAWQSVIDWVTNALTDLIALVKDKLSGLFGGGPEMLVLPVQQQTPMAGGPVVVNLTLAPAVMLSTQHSAQEQLIPYIIEGIRRAKAQGVI